jgi:hypothetical protein
LVIDLVDFIIYAMSLVMKLALDSPLNAKLLLDSKHTSLMKRNPNTDQKGLKHLYLWIPVLFRTEPHIEVRGMLETILLTSTLRTKDLGNLVLHPIQDPTHQLEPKRNFNNRPGLTGHNLNHLTRARIDASSVTMLDIGPEIVQKDSRDQ